MYLTLYTSLLTILFCFSSTDATLPPKSSENYAKDVKEVNRRLFGGNFWQSLANLFSNRDDTEDDAEDEADSSTSTTGFVHSLGKHLVDSLSHSDRNPLDSIMGAVSQQLTGGDAVDKLRNLQSLFSAFTRSLEAEKQEDRESERKRKSFVSKSKNEPKRSEPFIDQSRHASFKKKSIDAKAKCDSESDRLQEAIRSLHTGNRNVTIHRWVVFVLSKHVWTQSV